ncbi:TPA: hypothetical protein ACG8SA_002689, partial [Enterococcus faecium]|uniref:hypothetical protein n=1 Tax=Enterococcus faecium TaxID=1352 RepID=UPI00372FC8A9
KKKALSIGTVRIKHFLAQKLALGTLWGGGRSTEAKFASSPPSCPKFQIFFKNFPALPLGKIASDFNTAFLRGCSNFEHLTAC